MLLVDAYNVLHHPLALREMPHDSGPAELAGLIAAGRHRRSKALLICDGMPNRMAPFAHQDAELRFHVEGSELIYAGPGRDADSLIERLIEAETAPRRLTVVSSDRRIQKAARRRRARVMPSDDFIGALIRDADQASRAWSRPAFTTEVPLSPQAIRYWKDLFKIDEADLPPEALEPARPMPEVPPANSKDQLTHPEPEKNEAKAPAKSEPVDPVILEALREWRGRLSLDDLDMSKWLGD